MEMTTFTVAKTCQILPRDHVGGRHQTRSRSSQAGTSVQVCLESRSMPPPFTGTAGPCQQQALHVGSWALFQETKGTIAPKSCQSPYAGWGQFNSLTGSLGRPFLPIGTTAPEAGSIAPRPFAASMTTLFAYLEHPACSLPTTRSCSMCIG
jgi:hypothetical protein